jgi:hypothetical protein
MDFKGSFRKNLSRHAKQLIPYTAVMFYGNGNFGHQKNLAVLP